uniref:Retrotransposon protein n=1 Tax=Nelumbo nucifera TaxID=4432 RepID=A0A822Z644_NELNU|nr:TPA_asm: hypothetical protein HUJ06_013247 [Nelumbo nucifera]
MLGPSCSGFGWDDVKKCITCEEEVSNGWVKSHPHAKGLRNKLFPFFDDLSINLGEIEKLGRVQRLLLMLQKMWKGRKNIITHLWMVNQSMVKKMEYNTIRVQKH